MNHTCPCGAPLAGRGQDKVGLCQPCKSAANTRKSDAIRAKKERAQRQPNPQLLKGNP